MDGQEVKEGQQIGSLGASAFNSEKGTASHLHYEILLIASGKETKIDPLLDTDENAGTHNSTSNLVDPQEWVKGNMKIGTKEPILPVLIDKPLPLPQPVVQDGTKLNVPLNKFQLINTYEPTDLKLEKPTGKKIISVPSK